jgi:anti-sigma B factor antagonist
MKAAELAIEQHDTEKGIVVAVSGELDLTTVSMVREALLARVAADQASSVIVDLSQVEFIDSAGLALLVEARKRLSANSRLLYIVLSKGQQPERVLHLVRFDTIMKLVYSLDEVAPVATADAA